MKRLSAALIATLALAGCAGSSSPYQAGAKAPGLTGLTDDDGVPYVTNGDAFADAQISEARLNGSTNTPDQTPKDDAKAKLSDRVRQYEFTRWDKGRTAKNEASRFGDDHWELKVFFRKAPTVRFRGTFAAGANGHQVLKVERSPRRYSLRDTDLYDLHLPYEKTHFKAKMVDSRGSDEITVSYKAYVGNLDVREDSSRKVTPGSVLECQLKTLRENTFAWVNNWTTLPGGRVSYVNDIIRRGDAKSATESCLPSQISFRGESLATSTETKEPDGEVVDKIYEHPVESSIGTDVRLVGNPAQGNKRMFRVPLGDNDVMVGVSAQDPADNETETPTDDTPTDATPDAAPTPRSKRNSDDSTKTPTTTRPAARPRTPPPVVRNSGDAFLPNNGGAQAAREVRDLEQNRNLPGVVARMRRLLASPSLQRFFNNANPFVPMIQAISNQYDVVAWIFVTARESDYFKSEGYQARIRGDWSKKKGVHLAWGPFQLHEGAADNGGISSGERDYFAPSACAAAQYVAAQVRKYPKDATIAILGYNQGPGGAGAAIYCSYHSESGNKRRECNERVNNGMSNDEYQRYSRWAENYDYTYAYMSGYGMLAPKATNYVNDTLATYFVSLSLTSNGFNLANAKRALPTNGTVMPPGGRMRNAQCAAAIAGTY